MTNEQKLQAVADLIGGRLYEGYSGRGMFGARCLGVVCDSYQSAIEAAAARGITGASVDNLGKQYIVYWPHITK